METKETPSGTVTTTTVIPSYVKEKATTVDTGQQVVTTKEYTAPRVVIGSKRRPGVVREGPEHATKEIETVQVTTVSQKSQKFEAPTQLFGPKKSWYDPKTGQIASMEVGYGAKAKKVTLKPGKHFSLAESQAISGLGLATTMATGTTVPILGTSALVGTGIAEGTKYSITGEHLTVEEAIGVAGISQLIGGFGAKLAGPRLKGYAERTLSESYMRHHLGQEKMMFEYGEGPALWKPTVKESFLMKVTGATPKAPAPGKVSATVTPSNAPLSMKSMEAEWFSFEMGAAPKTSLVTYSKPPVVVKPPSVSNLPLFFGLGSGGKPTLVEFKYKGPTVKIEKGLPESQLAYDYRGPLSFRKYPLTLEYAQGRQVGYAWKGPYQKPPTSNVGMKPIWDKIGVTKTPSLPTGKVPSGPLIEVSKVVTSGGGAAPSISALPTTIQQTKTSPFMWQGPSYYPNTKQTLEVEQVVVSYPKGGLPTPTIIQGPSLTPKTHKKQRRQTFSLPIEEDKSVVTPVVTSIVTPITTDKVVERTAIQNKWITDLTAKTTPVVSTPPVPPSPSKSTTIPPMIDFPRGGGDSATRSFDRLTGRWFPRKHKVKTWDQMLKTFGLGKAVGKTPKSLMKISRMEVPGFAAFKPFKRVKRVKHRKNIKRKRNKKRSR